MTSLQIYDMLVAKEMVSVAESIMSEKAKDLAVLTPNYQTYCLSQFLRKAVSLKHGKNSLYGFHHYLKCRMCAIIHSFPGVARLR